MRKQPTYKEDATKGRRTVLNPKTYKGDVMTQVWLDSRMLATLDAWLSDNGVTTRFMSDIVRESMNTLLEFLLKVGDAELINHTTTARDCLQHKFRVNLNQGERGRRNVLHNKILSEGSSDMIRPGGNTLNVPDQPTERTPYVTTDEQWAAIQNSIKEEEAKEKKEAYEAIGLGGEDEGIKYDENGLAILVPRTNDQYTMKDKIRDDKLKLVKELEKVKKVSGEGDVVRMKSEEELDADDTRREKKDADYLAAQNAESPKATV